MQCQNWQIKKECGSISQIIFVCTKVYLKLVKNINFKDTYWKLIEVTQNSGNMSFFLFHIYPLLMFNNINWQIVYW